jgi:RNA polymerase sigma-70 factor, ECF subfamily
VATRLHGSSSKSSLRFWALTAGAVASRVPSALVVVGLFTLGTLQITVRVLLPRALLPRASREERRSGLGTPAYNSGFSERVLRVRGMKSPVGSATSRGIEHDDDVLLNALQRGDERIFSRLVECWSPAMLRLALSRVENRAIAEEVVQDAWLTVIRSLNRFERRSMLRTWVFGIVINLARSRARAERRTVPPPDDASGPVVDPARFLAADHPRWPHHWAAEPGHWRTPEADLLAAEIRKVILEAIATLPAAQREVLVLRDVEGIAAGDVCNAVGVTDTHQRVLWHRARSRVRNALERYFAATEAM